MPHRSIARRWLNEMQLKARNERGVALLIALLSAALLIALVFEFAYDTRISLRAAANFRDAERAYFLARSGVNFVGKLLANSKKRGRLQEYLEQKEWMTVPIVSSGDAELRVRWEDERGKINAAYVREGNIAFNRLSELFLLLQVNQDVLTRISDEKKTFVFLNELHRFLPDEDFQRVKGFLTVYSDDKINVNTAPEEVLKALKIDPLLITGPRSFGPIDDLGKLSGIDQAVKHQLTVTGDVFSVTSIATVGEYSRRVDAVIRRGSGVFSILYWRSM